MVIKFKIGNLKKITVVHNELVLVYKNLDLNMSSFPKLHMQFIVEYIMCLYDTIQQIVS